MKKAFPTVLLFASAGLLCSSAALAAGYQGTQTILYSFTNGADGSSPVGPLAPDSYGDLFGVTRTGGLSCAGFGGGCGTVFEIDASGQFRLLYQFTGAVGGASPLSGPTLIRGKLYGSALGGTYQGFPNGLSGMVYSINPDGSSFTVLHEFLGKDGFQPNTPVLPAPGGGLYGATEYGGPAFNPSKYNESGGIIYLLQPNGALEILHHFTYRGDGYAPASIAEDAEGDLFGTTATSSSDAPLAFRIDRATRAYQVIYTLPTHTHAYLGSVDANGVVYGAYTGSNTGSMFTLTPTGSGTYQYAVVGAIQPHTGGLNSITSGPVLGPNGDLVATSIDTLDYEISNHDYSFNLAPPGGYVANLSGPVNVAADGSVYGAIQTGGTYLQGAIYKFTITKSAQ